MAKKSVYEIITEQIIGMLDKGVVPWRKPWVTSEQRNAITKNYYSGLNTFILDATQMIEEYPTSLWCSVNQARRKKGQIRKGEEGTKIIFWRPVEVKEDGETTDSFCILRYYTVFNVAQFDWEDGTFLDDLQTVPNLDTKVDPDVFMYENMPVPVKIEHGKSKAYYSPMFDYVGMPNPENFDGDNEYYCTEFHEIIHATGHFSRLGRFQEDETDTIFGSASYSKEELVAEFGAAMLCAVFGIEDERVLENSGAYIANYKERLLDDPKLLVQAASKATKAVKYILGDE